MATKDEALKLALVALEVSRNTLDASRNWLQHRHDVTHDLAITAIREALAEQPSKPLTDGLPCCGYTDASAIKWNEFNHAVQCHNCGQTYTQTPNKPLTLEYIDQHIGADEGDREAVVALVREVEAAHGIKENT